MDFKQPVVAYTASGNIEAHLIVEMLHNNGISALAVEDQSGASLWAFGRISQFHKPKIWIDKPTEEKARELLQQYEENNRKRNDPDKESREIIAVCEQCGKSSTFPGKLDGTTQNCPHCEAYIDVGELDWEDNFGEPEE